MAIFRAITGGDALREWPVVWSFIADLAEKCGETFEHGRDSIRRGEYMALLSDEWAVVLVNGMVGDGQTTFIKYAAGELPSKRDISIAMAAIVQAALLTGSNEIALQGRVRGWSRVLNGFEQIERDGVNILRKAL